MSDSSSSDDEPMISSPDASENEGASDDDDVFKFKAKRFQKTTIKPPSPPSRKRTSKQRLSMESKLSMMERQKEIRARKLQDRISCRYDDDDSDSEGEIAVQPLPVAKTALKNDGDTDDDSSIIEIVDPPPNYASKPSSISTNKRVTRSRSRASAPKDDVVELIDDSSEDEVEPASFASIQGSTSKETLKILERSRQAKQRLRKAQNYHAEDITVEVQSPPQQPLCRPIIAKPSVEKTKPANLGKILRVTCRTQLEVNGRKQTVADKILLIREQEPLQVLLDKLLKAHSWLPSTRVLMTFDGETLPMTRTPASYEMEDEDLIDISAKSIHIPLQTKTNTNLGPKIKLKLRRKVGKQFREDELQIGQREHFTNLLQRYQTQHSVQGNISLHFDGEPLQLEETPTFYEMEAGDLIDVIGR